MFDYEKLGFKCGIEIHQQLNTNKLFCDCPCIIENKKRLDKEIIRRIRFSLSEMGDVDRAVREEFEKNQIFKYRYSDNTACLVELDEEPPHNINEKALEISVKVAKMLNMNVFDKIIFMRKLIIDGSTTSGFQRTALIGIDGNIKINDNKIAIESLCLEEDSAKIIKKDNFEGIYSLDRLGIPLIEIATGPNIRNPIEAREVAKYLGNLLRSFKEIKRGLGTIRQDLNVSLRGGERVELKGVQSLDLIPQIIDNEIRRQLSLKEIIDEVKKRGITKENFSDFKIYNITNIFKGTKSNIIKSLLKKNNKIYGIKINKLRGLLGKEIQEDYRLATEISNRIKLKFSNVKGLFHRDELPNYGISEWELNGIEKCLNINKEDNYILIGVQSEIYLNVFKEVFNLLSKMMFRVISEVRKIDGVISKYMREMPGSSRMYPETDVPVKDISGMIDVWGKNLPELYNEKLKRLGKKWSIEINKVNVLLNYFSEGEIEKLLKYIKINTLYTIVYEIPKEIKYNFNLKFEDVLLIANYLSKDLINKKMIKETYRMLNESKINNIKEYLEKHIFEVDERDIIKVVKNIIKNEPNIPEGALIGQTIKIFNNKVSGKKIKEIINKINKDRS